MKNAKIVLVARWDGWCGACAAERPLVLTRTGRLHPRSWLTGAAQDSRPLVLTCRLCGTGVDVPREQDDPPVADPHEPEEVQAATVEPAVPAVPVPAVSVPAVPVPAVPVPAVPVPGQVSAAELTAGRQLVAQALGGLLARRAATVPATPAPAPAAVLPLPLQRTGTSGGLAELQLLADGIDLLSSRRS